MCPSAVRVRPFGGCNDVVLRCFISYLIIPPPLYRCVIETADRDHIQRVYDLLRARGLKITAAFPPVQEPAAQSSATGGGSGGVGSTAAAGAPPA